MEFDSSDLIMAVEEVFALKFADEDLLRIRTVGDLIRYTRDRAPRVSVNYCATSRTFFRLRAELMRVVPLSRGQIHPRGALENLIPLNERRRVWRELRGAGLVLPALEIPQALFDACAILLLATAAAAFVWFQSLFALLLLIPLALLLRWATRPWAVHFGMCRDVRAAVFHLVPALARDSAGVLGNPLSNRETAEKIRQMIAEITRLPMEKLTDDARFVEDLGSDKL